MIILGCESQVALALYYRYKQLPLSYDLDAVSDALSLGLLFELFE